MQKNRILIELDCLLDTRLGTAFMLNDSSVLELVDNGYQFRVSDELDRFTTKFTNEEYTKAYKERTTAVLVYSQPTSYYLSLHELTSLSLDIASGGDPEANETEVIINTFPYDLEAYELEVLASSIGVNCAKGTKVSILNLDYKALSPKEILNMNIGEFVCYNLQSWIDSIEDTEVLKGAPELILTTPALLKSKAEYETNKSIEIEGFSTNNPFELLKITYAPYFNFNFTDVSLFSLYTESDI